MSANEKVVVVGAGLMGVGIAHAFAVKGIPTALVDVSQDALAKAVGTIGGIIDQGVKLGKLSEDAAKAGKAALSTNPNLTEAARGASLVIETASESMAIKLAIAKEAEAVVAEDAIISTNTSALSVTEIAATLKRPQLVAGMHFFNPVQKMKLVEIVRGLQTSDATVARIRTWSDRIGKTSIVVNESPGLTTSRMSAMLGNEAMYMLQEGTASAEDIDTALRLGFNHPMGPLETGDMTGWDTRLAVLQYLHSTLGEKFRPCPLIIKMVKAGHYGRKTGRGVYEYVNGERVPGSGLKIAR